MPQPINYSDTTPAAPAGKVNNKWQADTPAGDNVTRNVSTYTPIATATTPGAVPTPPNDVTKFLAGDMTYQTVSTSSSLATDTDVTLGGLADKDILSYDAGSSKWKNKVVPLGFSATLFTHFADAGSVSTGETDLYSDTLAAGQFASNGDAILARYAGTFVNSTSTKQLRAYLDGNLVFDSGALVVGATDSWELQLILMRESSSNVRVSAVLVSSLADNAQYTKVTGLTLSSTMILKITGTAAGAGVADGDITASEALVYTTSAASGGGGGGGVLGPAGVHDCLIWCKGDYITGLSDGDPVKSWKNAIEGGPSMNYRAVVTPPVYKTGIINSLPVVRFAANGGLRSFIPFVPGSGESTVLMVLKMGNLSPTYTGILTSTRGGWGFYIKSNGKTALYTNGTNYDGSGAYTYGTSVFQIVTIVYGPVGVLTRAALATDFSDSSSAGFQDVGTAAQAVFALGDDETAGSRVLNGDIAEFLAYPRALSATEYGAVENYLKTKYGL